jgi:putative Mn2+ efflux pump MntP
MGITEILMIGIALSMDAFAVAVCKGLNMRRINKVHTALIGLFFGVFQAGMPLIGWLLGKQFERYIVSVDHWIAFGLLAFLGVRMIIEAVKEDDEDESENSDKLDLKELTLLAVATSIDALAVGITFAFLKVNILLSVSVIGVTTFTLSVIGVIIGSKFGSKFKSKAEIAGGIILVAMGAKLLLEHLGILVF